MPEDCACHVIHPIYSIRDGGVNCDYFLEAVLPANENLHKRVWAEAGKQKRRERQRKKYWGDQHPIPSDALEAENHTTGTQSTPAPQSGS